MWRFAQILQLRIHPNSEFSSFYQSGKKMWKKVMKLELDKRLCFKINLLFVLCIAHLAMYEAILLIYQKYYVKKFVCKMYEGERELMREFNMYIYLVYVERWVCSMDVTLHLEIISNQGYCVQSMDDIRRT